MINDKEKISKGLRSSRRGISTSVLEYTNMVLEEIQVLAKALLETSEKME